MRRLIESSRIGSVGEEIEMAEPVECIIIGGGPAGLTAAVYLARFLRKCVVIDAGAGRAATIPTSHNLPGFPDGISGTDFLDRLQKQALLYGADIRSDRVDGIAVAAGGFVVQTVTGVHRSTTVLIASGVVNHRPDMPTAVHDTAVATGLIRYCPVCDGYEARGRNIGVLGSDSHGAREAGFLRRYSDRVTLLAQREMTLSEADRACLLDAGVNIVDVPTRTLEIKDGQLLAHLSRGGPLAFDTLYPALGSSPRTELARQVGASICPDGSIKTDAHQQTDVPGCFAAGDVVEGLDQISVATGQGAKAATAIHNLLREYENEAFVTKAYSTA